jgi:flagellar motility protein MotE (MotC chaperone)
MNSHNPYKLFDYYTQEEADIFFGREVEISSVIGDILANKLLVLFARSGSGKTSLLNAGVGPEMRKLGCLIEGEAPIRLVTVRLTSNVTPQQSALQALHQEIPDVFPIDSATSDTLYNSLKRHCSIPKAGESGLQPLGLVLVFDQFEEMFISVFKDHRDIRSKFAKELAQIVYDEALRVYVVLSLRSDSFHHLNEFRAHIPTIFQNNTNLELRPFDDATALRVIRGPAERERSGFKWQDGLPERIVADLKDLNEERDGVLPIHLQIVCFELYECLGTEEREITFDHYRRVFDDEPECPGQSAAAKLVYRRIIVPLEQCKERPCYLHKTLHEFITKQQTKVARNLAELRNAVPQKHLNRILPYLEEKLLLNCKNNVENPQYELRHDYLARVIFPWLVAREAVLREKAFRSRIALLILLILFTTILTKLVVNWNTFRAHIGLEGHTNELMILREPMGFGLTPSWWKREIATGFFRPGMLAGGVPKLNFAVSPALTDWLDVEPHLRNEELWTLQLGTRLAGQGAGGASNSWPLEVIKHPDIHLYATADQRIRSLLLYALEAGNTETKDAAIRALGSFARSADTNIALFIVPRLLELLKHSAPEVNRAAARAVAAFAPLSDANTTAQITTSLRHALTNSDAGLVLAAVNSLSAFAGSPDTNVAKSVVPELCKLLKHSVPKVNRAAAWAVAEFAPLSDANTTAQITASLRHALTNSDSGLALSAVNALSAIAKSADTNTAKSIVADLRTLLVEYDPNAPSGVERFRGNIDGWPRSSNSETNSETIRLGVLTALTRVVRSADTNTATTVIDGLGALLKADDNRVRLKAAQALADFAKSLDSPNKIRIFKDLLEMRASDALSAATSRLAKVYKSMDPNSAAKTIEILENNLTNSDSGVRRSAAVALNGMADVVDRTTAGILVPKLRKLLTNDLNSGVRFSAAIALAAFAKLVDTGSAVEIYHDIFKMQNTLGSFEKYRLKQALGAFVISTGSNKAMAVPTGLLRTLTNSNPKEAVYAIGVLRAFASSVDANTASNIVSGLRKSLQNPQLAGVRSDIAATLAAFSKSVDTQSAADVVNDICDNISNVDAGVAQHVLTSYSKSVESNTAVRVVNTLLPLLNKTGSESESKIPVVDALGAFASSMDTNTTKVVIAHMRKILVDSDIDVKLASARALAELAKNGDPETVRAILADLCSISFAESDESSLVLAHLVVSSDHPLTETLAVIAKKLNPETAGLVLSALDVAERRSHQSINDIDFSEVEYKTNDLIQRPNKFQDARRTFAKVLAENSNQEDSKLLSWVASDDSRLRVFACHVLAHRKSMNSNTLRKILDIRENGRPWAKMAALRCLVEMARGKELEKTHPIRSLKAVPNPMGIDIDQMLE